ncbi:hypothetical protein E2C01_072119 [Portunus trituberculatus]|uniref:Uncharacterized protein n=1 Tax=Portunus trituberculatus TaxID=210409 RepID=A0A5B7HZ33_PORTR|nr:hypothetical protein [Portunus trituberculatus]
MPRERIYKYRVSVATGRRLDGFRLKCYLSRKPHGAPGGAQRRWAGKEIKEGEREGKISEYKKEEEEEEEE